LDKVLTISGPGANLLTVQRNGSSGNFRIVGIASNIAGNITISGLTVSNGRAIGGLGGAAIFNQSRGLIVTNCIISAMLRRKRRCYLQYQRQFPDNLKQQHHDQPGSQGRRHLQQWHDYVYQQCHLKQLSTE
jgi:hypothetical protein